MTNLPLLTSVCLFASLALGGAIALVQADDRRTAREHLASIDPDGLFDLRRRSLAAPILRRLAKPAARRAGQLARLAWPSEQVEATRTRLQVAGISDPQSAELFLAIRILGFVLAPVLAGLALTSLHLSSTNGLAVAAGIVVAAVAGPSAWLSRKVDARKKELTRSLPDVLDLLTISVEAGLGFEQALDRVVRAIPGALTDEFSRMLGETRAGASRADALRSMDERTDLPDLRSFVLALIQADKFGVSIGRILRAQSDDMRIKRRQRAQEKAMKAPVKMLIPLVFCIFPALFIVVIGPAVINLMTAFR